MNADSVVGDDRATPEELTPVTASAIHEVIDDRLRRAIHLGHYHAGERLPTERDLASALGVSRVSLREALSVLEREGYISARRRGGGSPLVLPPGEPAKRRLRYASDMLDTFAELLEFRAAIESEAARLAATRRTDDLVAELTASQDAMKAAINVSRFRAADSAFHLAIATAARNDLLYQAIEDARARMFAPLDHVPFEPMIRSSLDGHRRILRAIERRQPDAAARAMRDHLAVALDELRSVLRR